MYTKTNFKTKKALKEAVESGHKIGVYQPNDIFGNPQAAPNYTGQVTIEGPHYPERHTWYATAQVTNGVITAVK